ncbi:unnamed protein product [Lota lota]
MASLGVCQNIMNKRSKKNGFGSLANSERFLNQDFELLKQYCMERKLRFIDDMFPPDQNSIGQVSLSPLQLARVEWLRPGKICQTPSFVADGISRLDFGQGIVGNWWFLASVGALTFQSHIFQQVLPPEQSLDYGIFHFRLCNTKCYIWFGRRMRFELLKNCFPIFCLYSNRVCGSHADMNAGTPAEALVDFTGGVHICYQLDSPLPNLWKTMYRAAQSKSLMGCGTPQGVKLNLTKSNGLVQGHAYSVTGVKQVISNVQPIQVVRLFNPWGNGEWIGDWSDRSLLWQTISAEDHVMCLDVADDGEFWMAMGDFCRSKQIPACISSAKNEYANNVMNCSLNIFLLNVRQEMWISLAPLGDLLILTAAEVPKKKNSREVMEMFRDSCPSQWIFLNCCIHIID